MNNWGGSSLSPLERWYVRKSECAPKTANAAGLLTTPTRTTPRDRKVRSPVTRRTNFGGKRTRSGYKRWRAVRKPVHNKPRYFSRHPRSQVDGALAAAGPMGDVPVVDWDLRHGLGPTPMANVTRSAWPIKKRRRCGAEAKKRQIDTGRLRSVVSQVLRRGRHPYRPAEPAGDPDAKRPADGTRRAGDRAHDRANDD